MELPWREIAREEQQQFLEIFGSTDWDVYLPEERKLLSDKVGLVMFGPPSAEYDKTQATHIRKVTDVITREAVHDGPDGSTYVSVVVVFVKPPKGDYFCHPVFRVPKYSGGSTRHFFVDCVGRVYKSWDDFLKNSKLPPGEICYPVDGVYRQSPTGQVLLGFGRVRSDVLWKVADGASNLLAVGSVGVAAVALASPVAAPALVALSLGSAVSGVYGAARAAHDLVDRKTHGQRIDLADGRSLGNWATIVTGAVGLAGVGSTVRCLKMSRSVTRAAKVGVTVGAAGALRTSGTTTPSEMFRDVRGKGMLLKHVSAYVLLFGHVVADALYVVAFLDSDQRNDILRVKSTLLTKDVRGETLRYLEFVGFEEGRCEEVVSRGIFDPSCKSGLSFAWCLQTFHDVKGYVSGCLDTILTASCFQNINFDMKAVIDFFLKYDLRFFLELCRGILSVTASTTGASYVGVAIGVYNVLKRVVDLAKSGRNVSFPGLPITTNDIVEVIKICVAKDCDFYVKFSTVYQNYILPVLPGFILTGSAYLLRKYVYPPEIGDLKSVPDEEILRAAGGLVGVPLDDANAKITYAGSEKFVIITDKNIEASVVKVARDEESGRVVATVLR